MTTQRVLCVDDEPNVLNGIKRQLRNQFQLDCAVGGAAALELLRSGQDYAVVVTDMRMPEMSGVELLIEVRRAYPDVTRLMLTGNSDLQTAVEAVNRGNVFRFLNKPCEAGDLRGAIEAGIEQHRLVTAEKELLSKTLAGSMSLLMDLISSVNPVASGRAQRLRKWAGAIAQELHIPTAWEVEIAALASQIGLLAVPETVSRKVLRGDSLSKSEQDVYATHPEFGGKLLARIPRLENVAAIVALQQTRFDQLGPVAESVAIGARILNICLDFDMAVSGGHSFEHALEAIHARSGSYDPQVLEALTSVTHVNHVIVEVRIEELTDEMTLEEHIFTIDGDIMIPAGRQITSVIRERLNSYRANGSAIREPIRVRKPVANKSAHAPEESLTCAG